MSCVRNRLWESAIFFWRRVPDLSETHQVIDSSSAFSSFFCLERKQQFLLHVKNNSAHKAEEPISDRQVNIDISTVITVRI